MNKQQAGSFLFIVKVVILIIIFGAFPVFVTMVAANYKNKAARIIESQNPSSDQIEQNSNPFASNSPGDITVLTEDQANTMRSVKTFIVGRWVSLQDKTYVVEFLVNGTFTDKDGERVVAYGTWSPFVSSTSTSNFQIDSPTGQNIDGYDNSNSSYYLTKDHYEEKYKNQKFVYEIMQLDQDRAILYYTGNSKILYFVRDVAANRAAGEGTSSSAAAL